MIVFIVLFLVVGVGVAHVRETELLLTVRENGGRQKKNNGFVCVFFCQCFNCLFIDGN